MRRSVTALLVLLAPHVAWCDSVELANGDVLHGAVIEQTDEHLVLLHPALGRIEIDIAEIAPPDPPPPGLLGTGFLEGFTKRIELGLNGQQGNTETNDLRAALRLDYEDEERRWDIDAIYSFSDASEVTTRHNATVALQRDWLFPGSRWFTFATGRYDWDQFRSWDQRVNAAAGVGYDLYKREALAIRGRLGAGVTKEFGGEADLLYEALIGLEAAYELNESHSLRARNVLYPALNTSRYRNVTDVRWSWLLTEEPNLSLQIGFENEYDSAPVEDREPNDFRYYTTIGLGF